jgi:serpin B
MYRNHDEDRQRFGHYSERPIVYFSDGDYYTAGTVKGVSLPYGSEGFYMTLLMPDSTITMEEFLGLLTVENWQAWQKLPRQQDLRFAMPKFRLECDISMTDILGSMGLDIAFDPGRADFSNMFVDGVGWIDRIKHKTFIQVDEYGTEAAATTIVVYADAVPPSFIADRPFIVVIHEQSTGAILFIGRISDPVWQE